MIYYISACVITTATLFFSFGLASFLHNKRIKDLIQKSKSVNIASITKQGFSAKKLEELGKVDYIIIGSGLSGLSAAALLARNGKKCLILEQHDVIGGCTHTFHENGYEFDTGVHYIGSEASDKRTLMGFLFHIIGMGQIKWTKMSSNYDTTVISPLLASQTPIFSLPKVTKIEFTSSSDETIKNLVDAFGEEKAIKDYFRLIKWSEIVFGAHVALQYLPAVFTRIVYLVFGSIMSTFFENSCFETMSHLFKNKDLIGVLTWCYGDCGTPIDECPFIMNSAITCHYAKGACYPTGGSSKFAESILPMIFANGGAAFVRAPVQHLILNSSGTAVEGVHVRGVDIFAPCVISSVGILNTYCRLIPPQTLCPHADYVRSCLRVYKPNSDNVHLTKAASGKYLQPSVSMISVFIGLKGSPQENKIPATNFWVYPSWDHVQSISLYRKSIEKQLQNEESLKEKYADDVSSCKEDVSDVYIPLAFISSSCAKDDDWNKNYPGRSVVEVLSVADFPNFWDATPPRQVSKPQHRGGRYEIMKERLQKRLVEVFEEQFPHLKDKIDYVSSGTPMTNNFYLGTVNGEVYGLDHSISRFTTYKDILRPKQPIQGLYITGQDSITCGLCPSMASGCLVAMYLNPYIAVDLFLSYLAEY